MESVDKENRIKPLDSKSFWLENDLSVFFGPAGVGKSIFAVAIAAEISKKLNEKVLYYDFELDEREFMSRFTKEFLGPNFLRAEPTSDDLKTLDGEQMVNDIENAYVKEKIKFYVVDNISIILEDPTNYDKAKRFVLGFKSLVDKYHDISILLVGHTPKRDKALPVTADSLAGSKALTNFCKSVFAIMPSVKGKNIVYVKQVKTRNSELLYDENNVIEYHLVKKCDCLYFKEIGTSKESEHLFSDKNKSSKENDERNKRIMKLHNEGNSPRKIEELLPKYGFSLSHTRIHQIIKEIDEKQSNSKKHK